MTVADDAFVRRHLTASRRAVLDIVADREPISFEEIVACRLEMRPDVVARHRMALPRMIGQILWRLENLEWISRAGDLYRVTDLGARARTVARADH